MHIDTELWAYFLSDAMSKKRLVYADDFGLKIVFFFYLKSDRFPVVSVLNKFMKMYSNTISIVHSNFREGKNPYIYLSRPYF